MKILVAIDDSKCSEAAVNGVANYLKAQTAEVRILHVLPSMVFSTLPQTPRGYAPEMEDLTKQAHALVDKYAEQLRAGGYQVDSTVESGDACDTIIDIAAQWQADLIVLGSHGPKGVGRLLLGSVAYAVVRRATCSVLIFRLPASK